MVRTSPPRRDLANSKARHNGAALTESRRAELVKAIREAAQGVLTDMISQLNATSGAPGGAGGRPVFFPHGIGLIEFEAQVGLDTLTPTAGLSFAVAGVKDVPAGATGEIVPSPSTAGRG